jgi:prepilin-type N-terminal cleavage/methylation domain-containing protein
MRTKAFTMIEVIIVVVLLGILAAVAIPKIVSPNEMIISSEGQSLLTVMLSAQKRWSLENNGAFTDTFANLDITLTPSNFKTVTAINGAGNRVASMIRNDDTYTLSIDENGIIYCVGDGCANARCTKGAGGDQCNQ